MELLGHQCFFHDHHVPNTLTRHTMMRERLLVHVVPFHS
jgi:hypothetical protein